MYRLNSNDREWQKDRRNKTAEGDLDDLLNKLTFFA
jgi:hypothetical protein